MKGHKDPATILRVLAKSMMRKSGRTEEMDHFEQMLISAWKKAEGE